MKHFDLIGIGIGPFNLGLAALLSSHQDVTSLFLERKPAFHWHEGLLLPATTLQVPFLADLVTMIAPTHPLSYLNYLSEHDRLYKFYYYENFKIPRLEYDHYCRWASNKLPACQFGENVIGASYEPAADRFVIDSQSHDETLRQYSCQHLAIGIGTSPWMPEWARIETTAPVLHSAEFLNQRNTLAACQRVTVIGSGQSAAECVLALYNTLTPERIAAGASIQWLTRSAGFHPMESSKLGQECFTPAYMAYFQTLSRSMRRQIVAGQSGLYKGISDSTIAKIFDALYEGSIGGRNPGLSLLPNCEVEQLTSGSNALRIAFRHRPLDRVGHLDTDAVVVATGYQHTRPEWFAAIAREVLATDNRGDYLVNENFIAQRRDAGTGCIFIQNAEIFQHGIGSPDLGMGAYRNAIIANRLLGREHYRIPQQTSFQSFGLPERDRAGR
ncbi:putative histamine N-monooxygenase [Serratia fonticola]|uniref:putative histamine N-monooxygenase n=1 Tax=Serratia fonticola TaxID=47917 RepID=UPI0020C5DF98|nr:putative histamine N-monooxygenase [Serratia fonticola]NTY85689.1 putative histamine N-monooxygenase [Serratia fonticola]NTZ11468.1 putative histamine N-monooxygenase [Serratia fonticola]